jgi:hypothetical protein
MCLPGMFQGEEMKWLLLIPAFVIFAPILFDVFRALFTKFFKYETPLFRVVEIKDGVFEAQRKESSVENWISICWKLGYRSSWPVTYKTVAEAQTAIEEYCAREARIKKHEGELKQKKYYNATYTPSNSTPLGKALE